jgi:hypothetical protein
MKYLITCSVLLLAFFSSGAQQRQRNERPERTTNQKNVNVEKKNTGYGKPPEKGASTNKQKTPDTSRKNSTGR